MLISNISLDDDTTNLYQWPLRLLSFYFSRNWDFFHARFLITSSGSAALAIALSVDHRHFIVFLG